MSTPSSVLVLPTREPETLNPSPSPTIRVVCLPRILTVWLPKPKNMPKKIVCYVNWLKPVTVSKTMPTLSATRSRMKLRWEVSCRMMKKPPLKRLARLPWTGLMNTQGPKPRSSPSKRLFWKMPSTLSFPSCMNKEAVPALPPAVRKIMKCLIMTNYKKKNCQKK
eukprot:Lithocolla_globosa_v1_NODE_6320_length_1104_cov_615.124881.p2 type:complete len:165 gc:universal NODE_6320_length_1104_cov_615.124881:490-984(+)